MAKKRTEDLSGRIEDGKLNPGAVSSLIQLTEATRMLYLTKQWSTLMSGFDPGPFRQIGFGESEIEAISTMVPKTELVRHGMNTRTFEPIQDPTMTRNGVSLEQLVMMQGLKTVAQTKIENFSRGLDVVERTIIVKPGDNTNFLARLPGDEHLFHVSAPIKKSLESRDKAIGGKKGDFVIATGDELNWLGIHHPWSDAVHTTATPDIQMLLYNHLFLMPLDLAGRLGCILGDYPAHSSGWPRESMLMRMEWLLTMGTNMPVLRQGGDFNVRIELPDARSVTRKFSVFHDPGSATRKNRFRGLEAMDRKFGASSDGRKDGYFAGHFHVSGAAMQKEPSRPGKEGVTVAMAVAGSNKGVMEGPDSVPDPFFQETKSATQSEPPNVGVVLRPIERKNGRATTPVFAPQAAAEKMSRALSLLDRAYSNKQELLEQIWLSDNTKFGHDAEKGERDQAGHSEKGKSKTRGATKKSTWTELDYRARVDLPLRMQAFGKMRVGSKGFEVNRGIIEKQVAELVKDRHSIVFLLGSNIHRDKIRAEDRIDVLDDFINQFKGLGQQGRVAFILLDGILKDNGWGRPVGKRDPETREYAPHQEPVAGGSRIAKALRTEMIENRALVRVRIGPIMRPNHTIRVVPYDHQSHHGSGLSYVQGMSAVYDQNRVNRPDLSVAAYGVGSGYAMFKDSEMDVDEEKRRNDKQDRFPTVMQTGAYSRSDWKGPTNLEDDAMGGQGGVVDAEGRLYPYLNHRDGQDYLEGLTLLEGLSRIGVRPEDL